MSASFPIPPQGNSRRASWLRRLIAAIRGQRILSIEGYARQETAEGITFTKVRKEKGGSSNDCPYE